MYSSGQWNDYYCTSLRHYICVDAERGCPSESPTAAPTTNSNPSPAPTLAPTKDPGRCTCFEHPDVLTCPLALQTYVPDPLAAEYALFNASFLLYKFLFVLFLRFTLRCSPVDLGRRPFLCFDFVGTATLLSLLVNFLLTLAIYVTRCVVWLWLSLTIIWLHIALISYYADYRLNRKLKAPAKPETRSNLEMFAYANNGTSWNNKAYNTKELRMAKKAAGGSAKKMERVGSRKGSRMSGRMV